MDNKRFLERTAEIILSLNRQELTRTLIVFPNKRPEIFLKKYIKEKIQDTGFWFPDIRSIDELITELSPLAPQNPLLTWFELYEIYKKLESNGALQPDEFINFAPVMLADFNDADLAMADVNELFTFLSKAKALERWHPDGSSLTDFEKKYIDFYRKLLHYYQKLKEVLAGKGMGTKGMLYRNVAETIDTNNNLPWNRMIFAGFNALTRAEEKLITELRKKLAVTLLWDADEYYIRPGKHNLPWQEAGLNLKNNFKTFKLNNPQWIGNNLIEDEKKITVVAAPGRISQVKFAGQLLDEWNRQTDRSPSDTAVVLSDESLLIPLLTSLPRGTASYNVTMGYPLSLSNLSQMFSLWTELLVRHEQRKNKTFNTAMVISLLQNQAVRLVAVDPEEIVSKIVAYNTAFLTVSNLESCFGEKNSHLFFVLFKPGGEAVSVFNHLMLFINFFKETIDSKSEDDPSFAGLHPVVRQEVAAMLPVLKKLNTIIGVNKPLVNLKVFQRLLNRLTGSSEISLKGEPLDGVQIMGMLETRLLDFKRLVILSANEGHLPKNNNTESFIPFDIRREYNLPLPDDKHAISAYYFFRLLQHPREVVLVYNSEVGNLGSGEKSRFLFQLETEARQANNKLQIEELFLKLNPDNQSGTVTITIPKTETALNKLNEIGASGFSPSALNKFTECPLKYYFSYILKLTPPKELRSNIEADLFGTIVHDILQKIYEPDLNKPINPDRLSGRLEHLGNYLKASLKSNFATGDTGHGKNLLIVQIIEKYIRRFVNADINSLRKEPRILKAVESELKYPVTLSDGKQVLIKGTIDRVDEKDDEIRVSDYKTGSVTKSDVNFKAWENLLTESGYSKAFQTLLYGWLYKQNHPQIKNIIVGLFSLRNYSSGFIVPVFPDDTSEEWIDDFEPVMVDLLEQLFDPEQPFTQTTETKNCKYCDFKGICNR
jgi:hypothetical protein